MLNYKKATGLLKATHYNKQAKVYLRSVNGISLYTQAELIRTSDMFESNTEEEKFVKWVIKVNRKAISQDAIPSIEAVEIVVADSFNQNRTFGVEIEFISNKSKSVIASAIRNAGVDCQSQDYNHNTTSCWKVITDGSVRSGWEIVSPILRGVEGLRQLEVVTRVLNTLGATVDRSTGLHIHHHAADLTRTHVINLFNFYKNNERHIDQLVAISRRQNNNRYTRSFSEEGAESLNMDRIQNFDRYMKLNFRSFYKYETIEFRQHQGSTDYVKISNWIFLTQMMIERHVNSLGAMSFVDSEHMVTYLNQDVDYWNQRIAELR